MSLAPVIHWGHKAEGPFVVERSRNLAMEFHPRVTFTEAMELFWKDVGQPSIRSIADRNGAIILWQLTGPLVGFACTFEVALWCQEFLPPETVEALGWIFGFFNHVNGQED